uniref:Prominin 1 b n=1 Tax=Denticeps clupeoides TaxID=299321 RepID=A0AAY4A5Y3_9TELE
MLWITGLALFATLGATSGESQLREDANPHADMHKVPAETLDFGFVPSVVYETHAYYEPGAIGILFHMVHAFLYAVQPNPFPKDLIVKVIQQNMGGIKTIYYELGFIVLALLGMFFVLLVPLVGLFFCLCRCCENCGGEMHQRQRKNADCQRAFYTTMLIATSCFISTGVLVAYVANHNISAQVRSTKRLVNTNIRDLKSFANYTPAQIDYLTAQYTVAKNRVLSNLENIGPLLGDRIHKQLEKEVVPALDNALRMTGAMRETKEALENVSTALEMLQDATGRLQSSLSNERSSLSNTLNDPACTNGAVAHTCNTIRGTLGQLGLSGNFHGLPDVSPQLANVDNVLKTDLSNIVQKGYASFNNTPKLVEEQTENVVAEVKGMLDRVGGEIVGFTKMFPVEPALVNFTRFLTEGQKKIEAFYPQIDQMDFYRYHQPFSNPVTNFSNIVPSHHLWIGCVVVCCMVVLILAFNFLGLLCGICGYDKHASPTNRGCLSNTGGNLLMAGVGFSFIFSWVLMGVVLATFVAGGNIEKLVCEPLANRELFKIIDTPYIVHPTKKNFLPGMLFQDPNLDLTIGSMYRDCHENSGLYSALQLETKFNFNKFINTTMFDSVKVDLQNIVLLEQEGRDSLLNFANTGLGDIDYQAYMTEVNKGVTMTDLLSFANELEAQADQLPRGALANALKGHASSIRQIHKDQVLPMEQAMTKVTNVLSAIDATEYLIANNASHVIKQETDKYVQSVVGYFTQYTEWVKHSVSFEVAQCKPISNIVDSLEIVGCSFIVDSVNTFWFGLGGCCLFLIPSIILSVKLAKYYRRMDTEDVFDDMEIGINGYQSEHLQGCSNPVMVRYSI